MGRLEEFGSLFIPRRKSLVNQNPERETLFKVPKRSPFQFLNLCVNTKRSKRWFCKVVVSLNLITILCLSLFTNKFTHIDYKIYRKDIFGLTNNLRLKSCHIPKLEPFADEILPFLRKVDFLNCVHYANPVGEIIFKIDPGTNLLVQLKEVDDGECCYRPFYRTNDADTQVDQSCTPIINEVTQLSAEYEYLEIFCHHGREDYRDGFAVVAKKPHVEHLIKRIDAANNREPNSTDRLNIIIFGIDATSHMNFKRSMPISDKYLRENLSAIVMHGYTKVAENTLPNVVPLLTGLTLEEFKERCVTKEKNAEIHLDNCPFIWKRFKAHGYRTSFAEDDVDIGIFNMNWGQAFKMPPTDYYIRPFALRMQRKHASGDGYCYGTRLSFKMLLDNIENLAATFKPTEPFFQFTWATKLSHDNFNKLTHGDEPLLNSLKFLYEKGHLNHTVLIVMSDHGSRLDNIRGTTQGQLEDRLPLLYLILPPWFHKKYPRAFANIQSNSNRLTSAFDMHKTLQDLMDIQSLQEVETDSIIPYEIDGSKRTPTSLFHEIPKNRTCFMAGVPMHWCVCHGKSPVELTMPSVISAVDYVVKSMNFLLRFEWSCSTLSLKEITGAFSLDLDETVENNMEGKSVVLLQVSFITNPGNAAFEATVLRDAQGKWTLTEQAVRTNSYKGQSDCVLQELKEFCYCKT